MATRTRSSGTGMAVALVIFVLLFVFALGAAIVVYTKVEDTDKRAADNATALEEYVKPNERTRKEVQDVRELIRSEKKGESVVGRLVAENEKLRRTIATDLPALRSLPDYLKGKKVADGKDLLSHIETLRSDVATLTTRELAEKTAKEAMEVKIAALEKEKKDLEDKYRAADAARTASITQIGQAVTDNKTAADTTFTGLQEAQTKSAEEAKKEFEKFAQEIQTRDAEIAELRRRIQQLTQIINPGGSKGSEVNPALQVDGVILSTIPSDNLVTIDLGENHHVLLGLTFEVFDKKTGVAKDQFGDVRGKASIEVVRVKGSSSECRVVRSERGKTILEGDVIANAVYDKHRTFKFYVYGNFDIDNDGRSSPTDTRRIKSMITQWGGIVADEFAYDVDFLLLGVRPQVPKLPEGGQDIRTPDEIEAAAAIERDRLKYEQLVGDAGLLRIPVLNQNRFLWLIGYYER